MSSQGWQGPGHIPCGNHRITENGRRSWSTSPNYPITSNCMRCLAWRPWLGWSCPAVPILKISCPRPWPCLEHLRRAGCHASHTNRTTPSCRHHLVCPSRPALMQDTRPSRRPWRYWNMPEGQTGNAAVREYQCFWAADFKGSLARSSRYFPQLQPTAEFTYSQAVQPQTCLGGFKPIQSKS